VVVKLNQLGEGPPGREAVISDPMRKEMMAAAFRRQEELKVSPAFYRENSKWCFICYNTIISISDISRYCCSFDLTSLRKR